MVYVYTFVLSVAANVASYYICKWLCGMPRPPLDRGGGIAQAMAERFSPTDAKKPPFGDSSSERGSFLLVLPDG